MDKKSIANRINFYTISAVYFLILVGGIVRSMEAGMGCPDWPKCFGYYIPPTSADGLPEGYEQIFVEKRLAKNQRLAGLLVSVGFSDLAEKVRTDAAIKKFEPFSVTTAWVEYVNRLIGVLIGFLIILNTWFSLKERALIRNLAIASLVLVLFQGWIGSLVVSTNLLPGFISFHMFLALLLVVLLLWQRALMVPDESGVLRLKGLWLLLAGLFIIQIFLGVNVREQVDGLKGVVSRSSWTENLDLIFYVHRSFSLLILGLIGYLLFDRFRSKQYDKISVSIGVLIVLEIVIGATLPYFDFPRVSQPLHLAMAAMSFGLIVYLLILSTKKETSETP